MASFVDDGAWEGGCGEVYDGRSYTSQVSDTRSFSLRLYSIQFLRDILTFFGVRFKITPFSREGLGDAIRPPGMGEMVVSAVGVGFSNINKSTA